MSADEEEATTSSAGRRRRRTASEPENAIVASRRPRRAQGRAHPPTAAEKAQSAETSSATGAASSRPPKRADADPWTVPQSVRDRFVQEGNRFYFPDGAAAFTDRGRRLTTVSENTEVVRSLVEIARSRGWTEVSVSGTEAFKRQAWQQARLAGLGVRGYRPSEEERVQVIRAIGRKRDELAEAVPIDASPPAPPRAAGAAPERIRGTLLEHGRDFYRHDPKETESYFVRIHTASGTREVWGKDIERAVAKSLSQPKVGEQVVLQRAGREAVTVKRREKNEQGELREREVGTFRNRWVLETQKFFQKRAKAAQVLRDTSISPRDATQTHPELAGTYVGLRAAELASSRLRDPEDRRRFVAQVRRALAEDIERGEPLLPVRLRVRAKSAPRERTEPAPTR